MAWPKGKPRTPNAINLVGQKFSRLTVTERSTVNAGIKAHWHCVCDCGKTSIVATSDLKSGHTKSCGCLNDEVRKTKPIKHGFNRTPTHVSWLAMLARCSNSNLKSYKNYGGRGITVCARWSSFENFLADIGERPHGRSIDRIDVNGNYEPGNCRWATASEQRRNQRPRAAAAIGGEHAE